MSLSNTSQLLLRNVDLLDCAQALLINTPADNFVEQFISHYNNTTIDCFNVNYGEHLALKKFQHEQINTHFSAYYQNDKKHDLAIISFPKSKAEFTYILAMIAPHLSKKAKLLFVGENKSGVKSVAKLSTDYLSYCEKIDSARHCSLFLGEFNGNSTAFNIDNWYKEYPLDVDGINLTIAALPGVFSQNELDIGTKLLLSNLPEKMSGKILDFGCGAGVISAFIGKKFSSSTLELLDVNALALTSAKKTLAINGLNGHVFASDSLSRVKNSFQHVVSNPPFHQGLKTHYASTESFLSGIKKHLNNNGDITIVANNFLRYQPIMAEHIGKTVTLANKKGFCVYKSYR